MEQGTVSSEVRDGVGFLSFSSPKANSLSSAMLKELLAQLGKLQSSPNCRVILVESSGDTFCAGASLDELKRINTLAEAEEFFSLFGQFTVSLRQAHQPVIVRVQGRAVGGGVGIVASADIAIGTEDAAFRLSEFSIGLAPFAISPVLEWKLGAAKTLELALLSDWCDCAWAIRCGLLNEVAKDLHTLDSRILELATRINRYPGGAMFQFKHTLGRGAELERQVSERAKRVAKLLMSHPLE